MSCNRRDWLRLALAAAPMVRMGSAGAGEAAAWPSGPIRLIVVYPAGGVSDVIARAMAQRLSARLGVPLVVENRGGASGGLGMAALAAARPDGHTLAFSAITPLSLLPQLAKVGYDPLKGIAPVVGVMTTPALLVATSAFEGQDFSALTATPRREAPLRWATTGVGTTGHLVLEQVRAATGLPITHIPYKGGGPQLNDALAGHFELLSTNVGPAQLAYIQAGRLKPLAVGAPARLDSLPRVPTFQELGLPQANLSSLFGLFAPAGVPASIVVRLNEQVNAVLAQPDMRQLLLANDNLPVGGSAADFAHQIRLDTEANRRLVKAATIRLQE